MAWSDRGLLTTLQADVLARFFARAEGFVLTGGAALAGFHLRHRETGDLDLFCADEGALGAGRAVLADVAHDLGATLETRQAAPGFRREVLSTSGDAVVVDLVRDDSATGATIVHGNIRVHTPAEIVVNKLCAVVGRAEERDLVDLLCLERAGWPVEHGLAAAQRRDGGATPATLAWLLSELRVEDGVMLPAGIDADTLRAWLADVVRRLRRAALPALP